MPRTRWIPIFAVLLVLMLSIVGVAAAMAPPDAGSIGAARNAVEMLPAVQQSGDFEEASSQCLSLRSLRIVPKSGSDAQYLTFDGRILVNDGNAQSTQTGYVTIDFFRSGNPCASRMVSPVVGSLISESNGWTATSGTVRVPARSEYVRVRLHLFGDVGASAARSAQLRNIRLYSSTAAGMLLAAADANGSESRVATANAVDLTAQKTSFNLTLAPACGEPGIHVFLRLRRHGHHSLWKRRPTHRSFRRIHRRRWW